jgi:hypothetical protein
VPAFCLWIKPKKKDGRSLLDNNSHNFK